MRVQTFRELWRSWQAGRRPSPAPELHGILISDDLETAQFMLRTADAKAWPVHVSVEALASAAGTLVRTPDEARAIVASRLHELETAALKVLARGVVADGIVLLAPADMPA